MLGVDKNLGHASSPIRSVRHSASGCFVTINFVFSILNAFPPEQQFCPDAKRAGLPGIDLNLGFDALWMAIQEGIEEVEHVLVMMSRLHQSKGCQLNSVWKQTRLRPQFVQYFEWSV